ncbi:MAG: lamin tail domain-containing protein [Brumimicrobium sp.]
MKQFLLSVSLLVGAAINAQDCDDLFISEYVEGWSNNKALELYNPTNQSIDLSDYLVQRYSNGSNSAGQLYSVQLTGTIEAYGTYVAVLDKRDPNGNGLEQAVWDSLQEKADGFYCPVYADNRSMYFNGNDAVVLAKGNVSDLSNITLVDLFGRRGQDPDDEGGTDYDGWTTQFPFVGVGVVVTTDHSLIRKSTIKKGVVTNPTHFDALLEWDSIPPVINDPNSGNLIGNWSTLGWHECECDPESSIKEETTLAISIYPNPSESGTFNITSENGIEELTVFNAVGQNILTENNLSTVSTFKVGAKTGVYLVNIRTKDNKVLSRRVIVK